MSQLGKQLCIKTEDKIMSVEKFLTSRCYKSEALAD